MDRIVVVDTETTGLSVRNGGRVIEVGAVAIENGQIVAELATLINTATPISYGAFRIHGISAQMLADKPAPEDVWTGFVDLVGDSPLVAHNAPFDQRFLDYESARLGYAFAPPTFCTLALARRLLSG